MAICSLITSKQDWNLYVSEEDFLDTLNRVEEQIAFKQSKHNGFLTYNDFCVLLQNENVVKLKWDLLKDICKVDMIKYMILKNLFPLVLHLVSIGSILILVIKGFV